ncbi:MAG: ABC transporter permease, partial [Cytophagales bacterium]|nr:ABC transporter permease [Cytophagales bacterium]
WYCHPEYLEDLEGDLLERFEKRRLGKGAKVAHWALFWDVLRLFRPGIIRTFGDPQQLNSYDMFKNNLQVSARSLMKRKEYSLVNVMGIAVGVTSALLISLVVQDELSHDRFFTDADRIYKMVAERQKEGAYEWDPKVAYSFTRYMAQDYAQVESATAIAGPYHSEPITVVKDDDRNVSFLENSGYYADGNFFLVFSFKLLKGNPKTALREPNSVVLTESMAQKYFGNDEPLGKSIFMNNRDFRVTGICEDPPPNSHFEFNYIGSSASISWFNLNHFNLATAHCYFKLQRGADPHALEREFPAMVKNYMPNAVEEAFGVSWEEYRKAGNRSRYHFKPLTSLHLGPGNLGGFKPGGSMTTVRILVVIAALIFIIACVNFINLAAARSMARIHEIGVRKVIGATKLQLIFQFFTESFILALVAVSIALAS